MLVRSPAVCFWLSGGGWFLCWLWCATSSHAWSSPKVSSTTRRAWLSQHILLLTAATTVAAPAALAEDSSSMYAPAFVQSYGDFVQTAAGWSYRDVTPGKGDVVAQTGDRVVFDWSGYTIGYFGST